MPKDNQKELFVVVDKNDHILGYKTRYECHHNKKLIHRAVGVVIFNDKGEILLQKRSKSKDTYPGFYAVSCSGHVCKNETSFQSAHRELFEEIGIKAKLRLREKYIIKAKNETEMEILFTTKHNGPFKIDKDEVEEVKFFKTEEIKKVIGKISPFAIESLKRLNIL